MPAVQSADDARDLPVVLRENDRRPVNDAQKARVVVASLEVWQRLQAGLAVADAIERARAERRPVGPELDRLAEWARECHGMVHDRGLTE